MHYLLAIVLLLTGCVSYQPSMCRHRAVECALVYGEKVGGENVKIAIGPSRSTIWHAQAVVNGDQWIVNGGNHCEIGSKEDFQPHIYMTTGEFIQNQFGWAR